MKNVGCVPYHFCVSVQNVGDNAGDEAVDFIEFSEKYNLTNGNI